MTSAWSIAGFKKMNKGMRYFGIITLVVLIVFVLSTIIAIALLAMAPTNDDGDIDDTGGVGRVGSMFCSVGMCTSFLIAPMILFFVVLYSREAKKITKKEELETEKAWAAAKKLELENRKREADVAKAEWEAEHARQRLEKSKAKSTRKEIESKIKAGKQEIHQRDLKTYRDALKHSITNDGMIDPSEEGVLEQLRKSMTISKKEHDEILMYILEGN